MIAGHPLLEHERAGTDHDLVERVGSAVAPGNVDRHLVMGDVAGLGPDLLEQVVGKDAVGPGSQGEIGRVDTLEMHCCRVVIRGIDTIGLVPPAGGNQWRGILVAVLQPPEFEGGLDILGGEGDAVVPLDAAPELPGDVHLVATHLDVAILQGGDFGSQLRAPVVGQLRISGDILVGLDSEQPFHRRVDVGAGVRRGGCDVAGQQAVLLLPGGHRHLPARLHR